MPLDKSEFDSKYEPYKELKRVASRTAGRHLKNPTKTLEAERKKFEETVKQQKEKVKAGGDPEDNLLAYATQKELDAYTQVMEDIIMEDKKQSLTEYLKENEIEYDKTHSGGGQDWIAQFVAMLEKMFYMASCAEYYRNDPELCKDIQADYKEARKNFDGMLKKRAGLVGSSETALQVKVSKEGKLDVVVTDRDKGAFNVKGQPEQKATYQMIDKVLEGSPYFRDEDKICKRRAPGEEPGEEPGEGKELDTDDLKEVDKLLSAKEPDGLAYYAGGKDKDIELKGTAFEGKSVAVGVDVDTPEIAPKMS